MRSDENPFHTPYVTQGYRDVFALAGARRSAPMLALLLHVPSIVHVGGAPPTTDALFKADDVSRWSNTNSKRYDGAQARRTCAREAPVRVPSRL